MKVYVLFANMDYEEEIVLDVYKNKELAEEVGRSLEKEGVYCGFRVVEMDVIE